ncbi:MAG: hypothetical protein ACK5K7_06660 [Bacilli bacterium]
MEYEIVNDVENVFNKIVQNSIREEKVSLALHLVDKLTLDGATRFSEHKNNISNVLFYNKLSKILCSLDSVNYETRINFLNHYVNGVEEGFAEDIILYISQINQMKKCNIFANLLKSTFYLEIKLDEWNALNWILLNLSYIDIQKF